MRGWFARPGRCPRERRGREVWNRGGGERHLALRRRLGSEGLGLGVFELRHVRCVPRGEIRFHRDQRGLQVLPALFVT